MNKSDNVVYITLVDFLIQLIFLGVLLFVAYSNVQDNLRDRIKKYEMSDGFLIEVLDGLGPFIRVSNFEILKKFLEKLKSPNDLKYLIASLKEAKSSEEINNIIQQLKRAGYFNSTTDKETFKRFIESVDDIDQLKRLLLQIKNAGDLKRFNDKVSGMGKVSCFASGSKESIMSVEAYDTYIKIVDISSEGKRIFSEKNMHLVLNDSIQKSDIVTKLRPLLDKDCAYYVTYIRKTDSENMRRTVESSVYIR